MVEFLRRAGASFHPSEDDSVLESLIDQLAKSTAQTCSAIDDALAFIEASNQRIAVMKSGRKLFA